MKRIETITAILEVWKVPDDCPTEPKNMSGGKRRMMDKYLEDWHEIGRTGLCPKCKSEVSRIKFFEGKHAPHFIHKHWDSKCSYSKEMFDYFLKETITSNDETT